MKSKISHEELKERILSHEYVPIHIKLSKEEAQKVLEKYNIVPDQLPKILSTDPIVKLIGAEPGDVLMIIRRSPISGVSIAYRYVVEDIEKETTKKTKRKRRIRSKEEEERIPEEIIEEFLPEELTEE